MKLFMLAASSAVAMAAMDVSSPDYSFESFVQDFSKDYSQGSSEYQLRKALFESRRDAIVAHNSQGHSYTMAINKFADLSAEEIAVFKGFNQAQHRAMMATRTPTFGAPHHKANAPIADSMDWRTQGAITPVKDQGGCGSCWAFGSAETLESHTFLHGSGKLPTLSEQQLVDCAPNPDHCGGTGGCEGSIPELAYGWAKTVGGLAAEADYPYKGRDGSCQTATPASSVTGFVNVLSNNYTEVMSALQYGPLAITVAAMPWQFYGTGIYTGCKQSGGSTALDHVVQLVGYGTESGQDYWLIRNSWGGSWGEKGYIRVERHADKPYCGTDTQPLDGTGCTGGPSTVEVCGSCGILYDAVYPTV